MRTVYETEEDKSNEASVREYVAARMELLAKETDALEDVDAHFFKYNSRVAIVEIKCRTNASTTYKTYLISHSKLARGWMLSQIHHCAFYLIVKFTDKIMMTQIRQRYETIIGGRTDRGDAKDMEKCALIPMAEFWEV